MMQETQDKSYSELRTQNSGLRTLAIQARGLGKCYGIQWALRGIDLDVKAGEAVAVFGGNGAGKSTLLRLLATLATPSLGTLQVLGLDVSRQPRLARLARKAIGVVSDKSYLYAESTAAENLELYACLYGVEWSHGHSDRALWAVGLSDVASKRVRDFSHGMQQRLSLARATLHDPAVLLLDEPDNGLDAAGIGCLEGLLANGRKRSQCSQSVVLATHNLELGLTLCGRAVVLEKGRVAYSAPTEAHSPAEWRDLYRMKGKVGGAAP